MARQINGHVGNFTSLTDLNSKYPPAEHAGCSANFITPYGVTFKYWSNGLSWLSSDVGSTNTHVKVTLLGDSITARTTNANNTPPQQVASAVAPWNWANAVLGAPFVFTQNLAVSGDQTKGIFSRIGSIDPSCSLVFVLAGINDILSSVATTTIISNINSGILALINAGKKIVISTILPNNALTGAQVTSLLTVNAYINTLSSLYTNIVWVVDGFAALGGNTSTGATTPTNYMNSDNTHPTSAGAQAFGQHASTKAALTAAYNASTPNFAMYEGWQQALPLYNEFRRSTNGTTGLISAGSGTIADNWRCLQNAGTATFTVDATQSYVVPSDFIGAATKFPVSQDSYYQSFTVSSAAANDNPRLRTVSALAASTAQDGIYAGALFFLEFELSVTNAIGLQEVSVGGEASFVAGTSPVDQPAYGVNYVRALAGSAKDSASAYVAVPADYHVLWRTPVMRIPENINTTTAVTFLPFVDIIFGASGSGIIKISKPRIYLKNLDRLGM